MAMWYCFKKAHEHTGGGECFHQGELVTVMLDPKHSPAVWSPTDMENPQNPKGKWKNFIWVKGNNLTVEELGHLMGHDDEECNHKTKTVLDDSFMNAQQLSDSADRTCSSIFTTSKGAVANFTSPIEE